MTRSRTSIVRMAIVHREVVEAQDVSRASDDLGPGLPEGRLPEQRVTLETLTCRFNEQELLRLRGELTRQAGRRFVEAHVERLALPLGKLAPYARVALPGLRLSGELAVADLRLSGPLDELNGPTVRGGKVPSISGQVTARRVAVRLEQSRESCGCSLSPRHREWDGLVS